MMKNRILSLVIIAMMLSVTMACEFSATTANIQSAKLSSDESGSGMTTVFNQEDTFWCLVQLANAPDDTKVKAVWTAVDAEGVDSNYKFDETEATVGDVSSYMTFSLVTESLWPKGQYKVDLYLNDKLDRTLEFTVISSSKIAHVQLSADETGTPPTTEFSQDQVFYCIVELADVPDDTRVKAVWTAVEAQGEKPDTLITETETTAGDTGGNPVFNLSNNQLWPTGRYKVDLYLNDKLDRTIEFQVK